MEPRDLWQRFETVHAVTYFTPECRDAHQAAGLKGFWMGYFAGRAAPLGAVGPAVVGSLFFNFHEAMVRRALPDAWKRATPAAVIAERSAAAAAVLRRLDPSIDERARTCERLAAARRCRRAAVGRALFAANRELQPDDGVEAHAGTRARPCANTAVTVTSPPSRRPVSTVARRTRCSSWRRVRPPRYTRTCGRWSPGVGRSRPRVAGGAAVCSTATARSPSPARTCATRSSR